MELTAKPIAVRLGVSGAGYNLYARKKFGLERLLSSFCHSQKNENAFVG